MSTAFDPSQIRAARVEAGDGRDLLDAAVRELASQFAEAMSTGRHELLADVLSPDVVYEVPGRSSMAGVRRGRDDTVAALTASAAPGTTVGDVEVTELMVDQQRAFVAFQLSGATQTGDFEFEVAFHLDTDGERIIGVTEYSGNQYLVDELLGGTVEPPARPGDPPARRGRLRRLLRRQ